MNNIFKSIEEGPKGIAFKGMCEIAHAFIKTEKANAEDEVKKFNRSGILNKGRLGELEF